MKQICLYMFSTIRCDVDINPNVNNNSSCQKFGGNYNLKKNSHFRMTALYFIATFYLASHFHSVTDTSTNKSIGISFIIRTCLPHINR